MAKKKQITDDSGADIEQFGTIFDHMNVPDPTPQRNEASKEPTIDTNTLLQRIAQLEGTIQAVASRPAPSYTPPAPTPQQWDWADPVTEPESFSSTLAQYTTYILEQNKAAERAEQERIRTQSTKANALWSDFTSQYKDFADKGDQVGYAYKRVTDQLAEKGVNVQEYAEVNRQGLFKQVVDEYTKVFGPLDNDGDSDPDSEGRSAGIFGGFESGGQPARGKEGPGDMLKDLKDIQKAMGIF